MEHAEGVLEFYSFARQGGTDTEEVQVAGPTGGSQDTRSWRQRQQLRAGILQPKII
jgi:hypothetical protein